MPMLDTGFHLYLFCDFLIIKVNGHTAVILQFR